MLQFFLELVRVVHKALNPPKHIRLLAIEGSLDKCLRQLEGQAGLPEGDLSLRGDTMKVAGFLTGLIATQHVIVSETSKKWRADSAKDGYISGSVTVHGGLTKKDIMCFAKLHISENCPGVFADNVCTTCGDSSSSH